MERLDTRYLPRPGETLEAWLDRVRFQLKARFADPAAKPRDPSGAPKRRTPQNRTGAGHPMPGTPQGIVRSAV